jgi:hypothetical protein
MNCSLYFHETATFLLLVSLGRGNSCPLVSPKAMPRYRTDDEAGDSAIMANKKNTSRRPGFSSVPDSVRDAWLGRSAWTCWFFRNVKHRPVYPMHSSPCNAEVKQAWT